MTQEHFPGYALRERREALGFRLADLYANAHIPPIYIEAIERGDVQSVPAAYAMGFLKTYCLYLEIDPEPFLDAYRGAARLAPPVQRMPRTLHPLALPAAATGGRPAWLADLFAWGAVCGLLVLGWLTYAALSRPFTQDPASRVDAGSIEIEAPVLFDDDL